MYGNGTASSAQIAQLVWNCYTPSEHLHTNDASKCFSSIYSYVLCSLPLAHLLPCVFHMDAIFIDPTRHSSTD